jgi:signal transduction histidine kinase
MVIQQASESGNQERINLALSEALEILQAPLSPPAYGESVEQEVRRKVQLWDGLCKFSVTISDNSLVFNESKSIVVGRVIEEGISNAIRHGGAKFIEISVIVASDNSSQIVMKNNGREITKVSAGMGTAFLEQASHSNWSLTSREGKTTLSVHLP